MSSPTFVILTSTDGQTYFNLRASNNEVVLTSETYTSLSAAKNGIDSVRRHAPGDVHYQRKTARDGSPYFVLRAANHEIIGTSGMYSSAQAREVGIAAVKSVAQAADVVDRRSSKSAPPQVERPPRKTQPTRPLPSRNAWMVPSYREGAPAAKRSRLRCAGFV